MRECGAINLRASKAMECVYHLWASIHFVIVNVIQFPIFVCKWCYFPLWYACFVFRVLFAAYFFYRFRFDLCLRLRNCQFSLRWYILYAYAQSICNIWFGDPKYLQRISKWFNLFESVFKVRTHGSQNEFSVCHFCKTRFRIKGVKIDRERERELNNQ